VGNEKVSFGEVNLREERTMFGPPHNPGEGGWPTIRYYNRDTGLDGGSYVQKIPHKQVCDELRIEDTMVDYVEDKANTFLCLAKDGSGCDAEQLALLQEWNDGSYSAQQYQEQLKEIEKLESDGVFLSDHVKRRKKLLVQLAKMSTTEKVSEYDEL